MLEVVLAKFIIMRTILTVLRKNGSVFINLSLSSAYELEGVFHYFARRREVVKYKEKSGERGADESEEEHAAAE